MARIASITLRVYLTVKKWNGSGRASLRPDQQRDGVTERHAAKKASDRIIFNQPLSNPVPHSNLTSNHCRIVDQSLHCRLRLPQRNIAPARPFHSEARTFKRLDLKVSISSSDHNITPHHNSAQTTVSQCLQHWQRLLMHQRTV